MINVSSFQILLNSCWLLYPDGGNPVVFNEDCQQCFVRVCYQPILLQNFIPYFPWVRPGDGNDINYRPTDLRPPTTSQSNHLALYHPTSKGFGYFWQPRSYITPSILHLNCIIWPYSWFSDIMTSWQLGQINELKFITLILLKINKISVRNVIIKC